ncbi:XapX domain-containing protein [Salmonella enterica]|uniref:DUF1427 family protein n=1 Tax=Salmonella enterica TaxID=28901 RepID=A0A742ZMU1_SALER|nr:XapX domain-containing protein [Salmonella enterica subsp. enterica serovar Enteritidis]EBI8428897.1 XapX domain-containing protein [Salmonella enterica]ECE5859234.1 xapX domain protein [Salmonella enterica subsp. enterica]EDV5785690.1 DUF1427 family protein [Salmonella enterica subsp. enterica serovar Thompson]EEA7627767.1 XapX domain-containing protein [Salmonella enterica subsp. enterica serovar Cerro]
MKEIILSSGIGFGIGAFFTLCRIPIPAPNFLPGVLSIVFMYIGYLVVKSIFY